MTITATRFRAWDDVESMPESKKQKIKDHKPSYKIEKIEVTPTDDKSSIDTVTDEDLMMGAYLLSHMTTYCENCGTHETPQWRKGWWSDLFKRPVHLCNACGIKFHKSQHCPYCHFVYGKEQEKMSEEERKFWLTCKSCGRWCHLECEVKCGDYDLSNKENYQCTGCRHSDEYKPEMTVEMEFGKLFRRETARQGWTAVAPSA